MGITSVPAGYGLPSASNGAPARETSTPAPCSFSASLIAARGSNWLDTGIRMAAGSSLLPASTVTRFTSYSCRSRISRWSAAASSSPIVAMSS